MRTPRKSLISRTCCAERSSIQLAQEIDDGLRGEIARRHSRPATWSHNIAPRYQQAGVDNKPVYLEFRLCTRRTCVAAPQRSGLVLRVPRRLLLSGQSASIRLNLAVLGRLDLAAAALLSGYSLLGISFHKPRTLLKRDVFRMTHRASAKRLRYRTDAMIFISATMMAPTMSRAAGNFPA